MSRTPSLLFAAALFALAGNALAQPMPQNNPAAEQNVIQSERYSQVLRTNPAFRDRRIQQECGPITDPQLHEECVASFPAGAPMSPAMRHHVRHVRRYHP
jgi:hypothetical protein